MEDYWQFITTYEGHNSPKREAIAFTPQTIHKAHLFPNPEQCLVVVRRKHDKKLVAYFAIKTSTGVQP